MLAVFAFDEAKEFVEKLGEAGEQTQHTATAFDMTTGEVQKLQSELTALGVNMGVDTFAMRITRAADAAVSGNAKMADGFAKLGVDLTEPMTAAERAQAVMEGFAKLPGPDKATVGVEIFSRQAVAMAGIIGASQEQLESAIAQTDKYGDSNETAVGKMAALGGALNENKNAWAGVSNVMGDSLAPAFIAIVDDINSMIAAFTQSCASGGVMRTTMEDIAAVVNDLGVLFNAVGRIVATVFGNVSGEADSTAEHFNLFREVLNDLTAGFAILGGGIQVVVALISASLDELARVLKAFSVIMADALTGHWDKILSDTDAGFAGMVQRVKSAMEEIRNIGDQEQASLDRINAGGSPKHEESPTATAGLPSNTAKDKKPKDDLVSQWQEQLRQIDDLQQNWYADQNALAAKFWQGIVASGAGSAKDQQQAQDSLAEALKALDNEDVTRAVEAAEKKATAAKGNVDAVEKIYADLEAFLIAHHAEGGQEWQKVEDAKVAAVHKATEEILADRIKRIGEQSKSQVKDDESQGKTADSGISTQKDQVKANASVGLINARQEAAELAALDQQTYENDKATQDKITADKIAALNQQWDLEAGNAEKQMAIQQQITDAQKENYDKQAQLTEQNAARIEQTQIQAAEKVQQAWRQSIAGTVGTFTSGFVNMEEKGTSFQSVMLSVGQGIQNDFLQAIDKMIDNWIMQMIFGEAQSKVSADLQADNSIAASAATGAAAVFASLVGDPLTAAAAPGAAAATYAEIMAYTTVASAAGGYDIPTGVNPITQLHQEEMVLPASISNSLRGMIASGPGGSAAGGGGAGGGSRGGDTYHMTIPSMDSRSITRLANSNAGRKSISNIAKGNRR
jgi:hypothetical protein